jgi:hypothetical protein
MDTPGGSTVDVSEIDQVVSLASLCDTQAQEILERHASR